MQEIKNEIVEENAVVALQPVIVDKKKGRKSKSKKAEIYRLEGEFELAKQFYIEAWKNSDKLDIPMEKYDILYIE